MEPLLPLSQLSFDITQITNVTINIQALLSLSSKKPITQTSVALTIVELMKAMKVHNTISNSNKKKIVVLLLEYVIDEKSKLEELPATLIKEMIPGLIDVFSDIGQSHNMFKKNNGSSLFTCC